MKLLWLTNIELPLISRHLGRNAEIYGGWLEETANQLLLDQQTQLLVLYPSDQIQKGNIGNLNYCSFHEGDNEAFFYDTLVDFDPDVIHIWGTEFPHTLQLVEASIRSSHIQHAVISIQGLVSIYARHYTLGLPERVVTHKTFHEIVRGNPICAGQRDFERRGDNEIKAIRKVSYVIGRTDFDYAVTRMYHPDITYFHCNETLRPQFYDHTWSMEAAEKHSIFISQCSYPVKGFHFAVKALSILKRRYPDVHLYTTGPSILEKSRDFLRRSSYHQYIAKLMTDNDLSDHITFLGFLDAGSMVKQYLRANVVVSPSTIENSSNSIGEAMLLGCPVVSSDVGGIKTLLKHEEEGLLYQADAEYMLAHSVERLFEDPVLASQLGAAAQKRALVTHDKEINFHRLTEIYSFIGRNACG